MSGVQTVAGTTINISSAAPATFTAAGYAALTFTKIGEITDGGQHGRVYTETNHQPIDTRGVQKFKGSFNEGTKALKMAISDADAGQVILKTGLNSDAPFYFKVLYQDGAIDFFAAKVLSFDKAVSTVDMIRAATCSLALTTSSTGVGIIEVPSS